MGHRKSIWSLGRRDLLKLLPPGVAGWVLGPLAGGELMRAAVGVPAPPATEAKKWVAKWIWCDGEPVPQNFYLYCRKSFTLEGKAAEATIDVTADSRYKLFVNGKFLGRGPVRCDQRWQYYDTYDLRPFLRRGENVVSAIVHQYGAPSHSYTLGRGGFLLQGEVREQGGRSVRLDSDASWRLLPAPSWDRESPKTCTAVMWQEIYDARKEPRGWQEAGFNDSSWQRPVILGTPPVLPWENLVARDIPYALEEEWSPTTVVNSGVVSPAPPAVHLDIPKLTGRSDGQVTYLFVYLKSPVEQKVALSVRGREGMPPMTTRIWANGKDVLPSSASSSGMVGVDDTVLNLQQGWNELLVKHGRWAPAAWFGPFIPKFWYWELGLGAIPGQKFTPVEWYAEPDSASASGQGWILGPYGQPSAGGVMNWVSAFTTPYEPEKLLLGRSPGSPVQPPGKRVTLDLGSPKNVALQMAWEERQPQATPGLRDVPKLLKAGDGPCWVTTAGSGEDPYVTLDFGKEVAGYVRLRLNGVAGGIVDLGYSEVLANGHVDVLRDHWSFADRYIMRDGPQDWELFFWKGFRYLQLTFRNCPKPVAVESVSLLFTSYPVKYRGSFECSDPLLTKIWEVGRWTLHLCMYDSYEDCPWREQGGWLGDSEVHLRINYVTFGDVALGNKLLRQFAQAQSEEGVLPENYPADRSVYPTRQPLHQGINHYMAQWVTMLLDHYRYTGDLSLVSELYPNLARAMACFARSLGENGLLRTGPDMNCYYYRALVDAATLAGLVGEKAQQDEWLGQAEKLKRAYIERLWSAQPGAHAPAPGGPPQPSQFGVLGNLLAVYAGIPDPEQASRGIANMLEKQREEMERLSIPYFYYFALEALRRVGRHQEALEIIRKFYGRMLASGDTTTMWEVSNGDGSRCHAWSAAPTHDLSDYVLGVRPTEPGYAALRVEPQPGDLTWAKGVVPTVRGDVSVEWKREGSGFELTATVPMKAVVELSVRARSLETTRLSSKVRPQRQAYTDGRARYWVEGPGTFRVLAEG